MSSLTNKVALVTGGGSGIGKSVCLQLAKSGAICWVADINQSLVETTVAEIIENDGQAFPCAFDVSNHDRTKHAIQKILEISPIDILINNAGIAHVGNIENTTTEILDSLYEVNVKGIYNTISSVIGSMKSRNYGVIINLASVASTVGIADRFAYSMTKGAVLTMTYSIARDYIDYGIRCNCVSPARVHTPFVDGFIEKNYPDNKAEMFEKLSQSQPIGRMGMPEEIAGLITYLSSDEAAFITGTNIPIDGGFVTLNN